MIDEARKRHEKRVFVHADIREVVNIFRGSFQYAIALQVIEHFDNPHELISMIRKISRMGLLFSVPERGYHEGHFAKEGHVSWWETEDDFQHDFGKYGKINFIRNDETAGHICGKIIWT